MSTRRARAQLTARPRILLSGKDFNAWQSRAQPPGNDSSIRCTAPRLHTGIPFCKVWDGLCDARGRSVHSGAHLLVAVEHADLAVCVHINDHAVALLRARHIQMSAI